MSWVDTLLKPEYLYRPSQIWRRLVRPGGRRPALGEVLTPWGLPMTVRPQETVGHALWHLGVLDLPAAEVLWRLLSSGSTAVDVGANIGFFTGLLARRAGPRGVVHAFEPHPEIFRDLAGHAQRWRSAGQPIARIVLHPCAASSAAGVARLFEPAGFHGNQGSASLEERSAESGTSNAGGRAWDIPTVTLDAALSGAGAVDLLKVDVEGHELSVFEGAGGLLRAGGIRDVVFEEHHGFPSPATRFLADAGYHLFQIGREFDGPLLDPPTASGHVPHWLPPNLLATRDPARARAICAPRGWQCLG
ncbi:MAG: FkbM family methyltransferase [Verrucomicrobiota bacterium]